jgi:predicted permease
VTQFALALSLVVGAGLLLNSFDRLQRIDPGYTPEGVLSFQITPNREAYGEPTARLALYDRILEQLRALPGVTGVAISSGLPFGGNATSNPVRTRDPSTLPEGESVFASWRIVDPNFFDVMQIGLIDGRVFTEHDDSFQNAPIILGRGLARRLWPDESAIGKRVFPTPGDTPYTVVGVVEDIALTDLTGVNEQPQIYYPVSLWSFWDTMTFAVRTQVPPETLTASVRRVLLAIDPEQPVYRFDTLANLTNQNLHNPRMNSWLLTVFAGLALLLAVIGIYAVMHTMVTQRTREIGVRMALGARRIAVLSLMLRQGGRLVLLGLGIGAVLAWRFCTLLENQLFETDATDIKTYGAAAVIISLAGLIAIFIPARRATKVDPVIALRAD